VTACGFLQFPSSTKFRHDKTEILLKVALNTITLTPVETFLYTCRDDSGNKIK
jgi:hypothetical protein